MRETIIEQTELLKDLPDSVLIKEMKQPTGNLAPPVFITSELKRRQRFRDEFKRREAQDMPTVAEEVVMAAGVPQQGIMQMARSMAPKTNMGQNTGMADMMPKQPTMGMSGGGIVKMQPGGMMGATPVVLNGFKYNVFPDGRVVPDMIGQPATPLDPNMTSQRQIIEQAMAAANNQTVIPEEPLGVTTQDMALADVEARKAAYEAANPNASQTDQELLSFGMERLLTGASSLGDITDHLGRFSDSTQDRMYSRLLPPTDPKSDPTASVTTTELDTGAMTPKSLTNMVTNAIDASAVEKDPEYYKYIPPNLRSLADVLLKDRVETIGSAVDLVTSAPEAISSKKAELSQILADPKLDDKQRAILESKISGLNLISGAGQALDDAVGDIIGIYQRFVASPAYQLAGAVAAPVDAVAGTDISDAMLGTAYDIKQRGNKNISEGFVPGLAIDAVLGTGPLPKKDTPEELIESLDEEDKTATINKAANIVKDAIGEDTLATASGAQGSQAASQAQQGFTADDWFQIAALGAMISSGNPEDLQSAAKTFLAMESKKADRKALEERAEKDRASREKIAQTAADAQAKALGQRIDKAAKDDLKDRYALLGGEEAYQILSAQLKKDKKLPAEALQTLTTLQSIREKLIGAKDLKKINVTGTA
tara:strand:- start:2097 stop:4055 length:1959 start_codon:yes stop_codon:yes gene_type:complete